MTSGAAGPEQDAAIAIRSAGDDRLAPWAESVGPSVALDLAPPLAVPPVELDVLSWNLAIGRARLDEMLDHLRERGLVDPAGPGSRPLVVLAQEAYRMGGHEAEHGARRGRVHGGRGAGRVARDIVATATRLGMSLRYAPSMANRTAGTDRGNAILATVALGGSEAWELPLVRQRRVSLGAFLVGLPDLRFASVHLENRGAFRPGRSGLPGGRIGRVAQATVVAEAALLGARAVVLGADLNSLLGRRDPAYARMVEHGFEDATGAERWLRTLRGPLPLLLDHLLVRRADAIREVHVRRIDAPGRLDRTVFGSDHHPILARVRLHGADARPRPDTGP